MQFRPLKRREVLTLLGGAAAWPVAAPAQQATTPVVGFLHARGPETAVAQVEAFRRGLAESGYVDGQNMRIEFRWARGQYDQLPAMAAELVRRPVDLLIGGSEPLKRHGFTEHDRTLAIARVGKVKIEYRNTSPALQICERGRKVFLFEWTEKGRESLVIYDAGDWERALDERIP